jgi:ribokinase
MKTTKTITGLGYCGMDYLCLVPEIPLDDKVQASETLEQGGGPAATATYAAAKLGARTMFAGVVGDDSRGQSILEGLAREGVDTSAMKVRLDAASPVAFCWIQESTGKRSIAWSHGSVKPLLPEELNMALVRDSALLLLDGHQTAAAIRAAKLARETGTVVLLDAGTLVDGIDELLALSDIIIASEKFSLRYTGESDPEAGARKLFGDNTRFAAVTAGVRGSYGFDGGKSYFQDIFPVQVVDTTGAGDVFHGAFAYKYVNGGNWRECMRFAAAVSALKCTRFGGRTGIPTLAEVEIFLQENKGK